MQDSVRIPKRCCAPGAATIDRTEAVALADRFKALADPTRVALINHLAGTAEACVCDFVDVFDLAQPTISHHLRILREAGFVTAERRGTWAYYRLVPEAIGELAGALAPSP
jgi:ArsR family transcriptional regulator